MKSFFKRFYTHIKENITLLDLIFCIFLGYIFATFPQFYKDGKMSINFVMFATWLGYGLIFLLVSSFFKKWISLKVTGKRFFFKNSNHKSFLLEYIFDSSHKIYHFRLLIIACIIVILWTPILIILYPGTLANDTWGQLGLYQRNYWSDHNPVLDTWYMAKVILPIVEHTENWHLAFAIYVWIQVIVTSLVYAYSIVYAKEKLHLNFFFVRLFLLLYCIFPLFPCSVQSVSKDAIFSWIYVLFFLCYLEIVRTKGRCLAKYRNVVFLVLVLLLCCLTKKIGLYVLVPSLLMTLFFKFENRVKIFEIILVLVMVMTGVVPALFEFFNIQKGGQQEKYSLFFQQTARYLKDHSDDITEKEKKTIEEVIGKSIDNIVAVYNPKYADPIKGFSQPVEDGKYVDYMVIWLRHAFRHPISYYEATAEMLSNWISFNEYKPLMNMGWHNQLTMYNLCDPSVAERTFNKEIADVYQDFYDKLYETPILKYLFTPGLYTTLLPLFSLSILLKGKNRRKEKYWLVMIPMFLSIVLGCFLAPDSSNIEGQRYMYPVTYTTLSMLMWVVYVMKGDANHEQ